MDLFFIDSAGTDKYLGRVWDKKEINQKIYDFLKEHNYQSYYTRIWRERYNWMFDVGSHTEFFMLTGAPNDYYDIGDE